MLTGQASQTLLFARWLAAKVARIGEPWKIRVRPQDMVKRLLGLGFREVFTYRPNWCRLGIFPVGPTN